MLPHTAALDAERAAAPTALGATEDGPRVPEPSAKDLPEAAGPEAHYTALRGQPLAAAGGATGALSGGREADDAAAPATDPRGKRPKKNKSHRLKGQAARDAALSHFQDEFHAAVRASWRLDHKRGDAASRMRALRLDAQAGRDLTAAADRAIGVAATEADASRACAAYDACVRDLRALVDGLIAAVAAVDAAVP